METWRQKWAWQFRRAQCSVPKPVALVLSATPKAGTNVEVKFCWLNSHEFPLYTVPNCFLFRGWVLIEAWPSWEVYFIRLDFLKRNSGDMRVCQGWHQHTVSLTGRGEVYMSKCFASENAELILLMGFIKNIDSWRVVIVTGWATAMPGWGCTCSMAQVPANSFQRPELRRP